jgi:hypothetical protein
MKQMATSSAPSSRTLRPPSSIDDLVVAMQRQARLSAPGARRQVDVLRKLQRDDDASQLYLVDYTRATRSATTHGQFTVLGAMKAGTGTRESYQVRMFDPGASPRDTFWCSCPDHKFNSAKMGTVCKHISFIVCKVAKIMDPEFFRTKVLSPAHYWAFAARADAGALPGSLTRTQTTASQSPSQSPSQSITPTKSSAIFSTIRRPIDEEDVCPICFDEMISMRSAVLACPRCDSNVHKPCMEVWLERSATCACCRSRVWAHYGRG